MNAREKLELAALAAGLTLDKGICTGGGNNIGFDLLGNVVLDWWHNGKIWNPHTDDGDSFRLMNALAAKTELDELRLSNVGSRCSLWPIGRKLIDVLEYLDDHNNRNAATRGAIFRVDVEVGRRMKEQEG